jgi:hypothetical protein
MRTALAAAFVLVGVGSAVTPMASAATAKHKQVSYLSGHLNASGYTVVVVGYNGKAVFSHQRSFRLAAPDSKVTVQLISNRGVYAGPITFGGSATKVITGVKAGTNLGAITVVSSRGYAHLAHKLAVKSLDKGRWAYAKKGVPLGNGRNFGMVSSRTKGSSKGPGLDPAHIGIPNEFNVAVPGSRVLKSLAPATKVKAMRAAAASAGPGSGPGGPPALISVSPWMPQMFLGMDQTVNVDAAGVTQSEIDATLKAHLNISLLDVPSASLVELNCNGLSFCSPGGSGVAQMQGLGRGPFYGDPFQTAPFPAVSLDPANGFGELVGPAVPSRLASAGLSAIDNEIVGIGPDGSRGFSLNPNASTAQIGSGDVITELVTNNGTTVQTPTTLDYVFTTVPAISAYSDTAGNAAAIAYPDTTGMGTASNPLRVAAGPNGDVVMHLTVFRPQRAGIPGAGEPAFMDIGHLGYQISYTHSPQTPSGALPITPNQAMQCPASSYSELSPSLSFGPAPGNGWNEGPKPLQRWLVDSSADQSANAANTFSFSINLTQCIAARGTPSFPVGLPFEFDLSGNAQSGMDHSNQKFTVQRTR